MGAEQICPAKFDYALQRCSPLSIDIIYRLKKRLKNMYYATGFHVPCSVNLTVGEYHTPHTPEVSPLSGFEWGQLFLVKWDS